MSNLSGHRLGFALYAALMVFLAVLAFEGLSEQWFDTDDFDYLSDTASVRQDPSLLLSAERALPGRPVAELLFLGGYLLWGDDPLGYHLLVVALHLVASLLLAFTFRRLGADRHTSMLGALLFLVNVAHFRAVQWISCLAYPLVLVLGLGAILLFVRYLDTGRVRWLIGVGVLQLLAVLSHASAVCLPVFFIYLSWKRGQALRKMATSALPLLGMAGLGAGLLYVLYRDAPQAKELTGAMGAQQVVENLLAFLGRCAIQAHWFFTDIPAQIELLVGAGVGILLLWLVWRRDSAAADWAVWSLLTILPFATREIAEPSRYLYLTSVGMSFILAWMLCGLGARMESWLSLSSQRIACATLLVLLVGTSIFSLRRVEALGFYYSGRAYDAKGMKEESAELFRRAIEHDAVLVPEDAHLRLVLSGFVLGESSREVLAAGIAKNPNSPKMQMLLAASAFLEEDADKRQRGLERIRAILRWDPLNGNVRSIGGIALNNIGQYHLGAGRPELAVDALQAAAALCPRYALPIAGLGQALGMLKRPEEAIAAYRRAATLRPDLIGINYHLAILLIEEGDRGGAVEELGKVVAADPRQHASWYLLAQLQRLEGDGQKALEAIRKALAIQPENRDYQVEYSLAMRLCQERNLRQREATATALQG